MEQVFSIELRFERDVVQARQRARDIASLLGFDHQEQIRIATATSEISRNAFRYARGGKVHFSVDLNIPQMFQMQVTDTGDGIPRLDIILNGRYKSQTGMGMGIIGTKRLMDVFSIDSGPKGTSVTFGKRIPATAPFLTSALVRRVQNELAKRQPESPYEEVHLQNLELMKTLSELRSRQEELDRLNREMEDTNRGVVALYAELEDRADYLRRTAELKTMFLSQMSHEFRTPLNSIISLTRMLMESMLSNEQRTEITFVQNSARDLLDLVNDLLDLAKIEAGKLDVRAKTFEVAELFGALRGMLKPLLAENSLNLVFEEPRDIPPLKTDEGKLSQILRNLISNAIKFTPRGEVRVRAELEDENCIRFVVSDTGIGIAESDLSTIFKEFSQVENQFQAKFKGTGLGLPLSQNLASLLGGTITVESTPGVGSTFTARILRRYGSEEEDAQRFPDPAFEPQAGKIPVLLVEDNHETQYLYKSYLQSTRFQVIAVTNLHEARRYLSGYKPAAIVLDLLLHGRIETDFIRELKENSTTSEIPIVTISTVNEEERSLALGAVAFKLKPIMAEEFLAVLHDATNTRQSQKVLLIDDNEVSRYVLRQFIPQEEFIILEARSGREGLTMALAQKPDIIFLDLNMSDVDGYAVVAELRQNSQAKDIPVVIHSSQTIDQQARKRLGEVFEVLPKSVLNDPGASEAVGLILARAGLVSTSVNNLHV